MRLPLGLRWWELLPEGALAALLGFFLATETSAATSAFRSTRAVLLMLGVGAGWLVARVVLSRVVRWPAVRILPFIAAAAFIANVVVLPSYRDETVVETLPVATAAPSPAPAAVSSASTTVPPGPVEIRTAAIRGIDHRASGTAAVYRQPDGSLTVALEDIDIQPGPDYDVYVVPGGSQTDKDGGTRLDDLRANKGTHFYAVPRGVGVDRGPWTVLVWCQTFAVPVAGATVQ